MPTRLRALLLATLGVWTACAPSGEPLATPRSGAATARVATGGGPLPTVSAPQPVATSSGSAASSAAPPVSAPCAVGAVVDPAKLLEVVRGSFTRSGAAELAALSDACAESAAVPVVAELSGDRWLLRSAGLPERIPTTGAGWSRRHCRALRMRDARDLLVCEESMASYGDVWSGVVSIDLARGEDEGTTIVVGVSDTSGHRCPSGPTVLLGAVDGFVATDVDGDGSQDVVVSVRAASAKSRPAADCDRSGGRDGAPHAPETKYPAPPVQKLEFLMRGATLVASPRSAAAVEALDRLEGARRR